MEVFAQTKVQLRRQPGRRMGVFVTRASKGERGGAWDY